MEYYTERDPRGEYVLVLEGASESAEQDHAFWANLDIASHVSHYVDQGLSKMDAIKQTAKDRGLPKNDVYKVMVEK